MRIRRSGLTGARRAEFSLSAKARLIEALKKRGISENVLKAAEQKAA